MVQSSLYTVGWICALETEYVAALEFLDEEHDANENVSAFGEVNSYTFGRIGQHNIVIAVLPAGEYGTSSAAAVASHMIRSFENLKVGLMVGIGGGAPTRRHDIRLGDVVVSEPSNGKGGVYQYDYGKAVQEKKFQHTGHLNAPPRSLGTAITKLKGQVERKGHKIDEDIQDILSKNPRLRKLGYGRPSDATDQLYESSFIHPDDHKDCTDCMNAEKEIVVREERSTRINDPTIHYGLIASANRVVRDAILRDALAKESDVLCFEMEAAGLMNQFPFLVIRGISDYSDTHKNDAWKRYAAMTAAAYAKALLNTLTPSDIAREQPIRETLQDIKENLDLVRATSQKIRAIVTRNELKTWLSPPDPWTNHKTAKDLRLSETGLWCLESTQYRDWKSNNSSVLWLHGIVGCGKTVLSSTIVEDLRVSGNTVLIFYFDTRSADKQKQSFDNMLRSLIWQLYEAKENARDTLHELYSTQNAGATTGWEDIFQAMLDKTENVKIVLDALDECATPSRTKLFNWLKASALSYSLRIFLTSRDLNEINSELSEWIPPSGNVAVQQEAVDKDIRRYIRNCLRADNTDNVLRHWGHMHKRIEQRLMSSADGMFRWAECQMDSLRQCLDVQSLEERLSSLPETLDDTYDRILKGIPSERKQHAIRLLQFLIYMQRSLRLEEAQDIVAVMPECTPAFQKRNRSPNVNWIARYCSSLTKTVTITYTSFDNDKYSVTELQLAHASVKEYLLSGRLEPDIQRELVPSVAHGTIVQIILAYFLETVRTEYRLKDEMAFPLLRYAATAWGHHAVLSQEEEHAQAWVMKLLTNETAYDYWLGSPCREGRCADVRDQHDPLFEASELGLERVVEQLLARGAPVIDSRNSHEDSALEIAYNIGHSGIVDMLLEKYSEVDAAVEEAHVYRALQRVPIHRHQNIVEKLLKVYLGLDVEGRKARCTLALPEIAEIGHEAIVMMLIRQGADVNAKVDRRYAIQSATIGGNEKVIELLVRQGAKVDARSDPDEDEDEDLYDRKDSTALQIACLEGHESLVRLLLEKGANVNARPGRNGTALFAAASEGHENVVGLLLDHNADPNLSGSRTNALFAATAVGHVGIVKKLIHAGANINAPAEIFCPDLLDKLEVFSDDDCSPLHEAASKGNVEVVETLLESGADIDMLAKSFGTPLHAALNAPHPGIARDIAPLLIEQGADVNINGCDIVAPYTPFFEQKKMNDMTDGYDSTALYVAAFRGFDEIVKMLIDRGAQVNAVGGHFGTALQAASFHGNPSTASILIANGAEVNASAGYYGSAWRAVTSSVYPNELFKSRKNVQHGREKVKTILLAHGVKTDQELFPSSYAVSTKRLRLQNRVDGAM